MRSWCFFLCDRVDERNEGREFLGSVEMLELWLVRTVQPRSSKFKAGRRKNATGSGVSFQPNTDPVPETFLMLGFALSFPFNRNNLHDESCRVR